MNQPLQTAALANLIVASRLPAEGNFRRDAILGAMVGQVNPVAGALVAIRSANSLTELIRERDALKAQQPASTPSTSTPPTSGPASPSAPGWPSGLSEENRKALQDLLGELIQAAKRSLESLSPPSHAAGDPKAPADPAKDDQLSKFQEAAREVAAALSSIASQAEKAVENQDENQEMMRQTLERMAASGAGGTNPSPGGKGKSD